MPQSIHSHGSRETAIFNELQILLPKGGLWSRPEESENPKVQALWRDFIEIRETGVREKIAQAQTTGVKLDKTAIQEIKDSFFGPFAQYWLPIAHKDLLDLYASNNWSPDSHTRAELETLLRYSGLENEAIPSEAAVKKELAEFKTMSPRSKKSHIFEEWYRLFFTQTKCGRSSAKSRFFPRIFGVKSITHFSQLKKVRASLRKRLGGGDVEFTAKVYQENGKVFAYEVQGFKCTGHSGGELGPWSFLNIFFSSSNGKRAVAYLDPDTLKVIAAE